MLSVVSSLFLDFREAHSKKNVWKSLGPSNVLT